MPHGYKNVFGDERIQVSLFETDGTVVDSVVTDWFFGPQGISAAGNIPSAEAFGQSALQVGVSLNAIVGAEGLGSPTVSTTAQLTNVGGLAGAEAFGSPSFSAGVSPSALASAEAVGVPSTVPVVAATSLAPSGAFGTPTTSLAVSAAGIDTAFVGGQPSTSASVASTGIPSAETIGVPGISEEVLLSPAGIPSSEAVPTPSAIGVLEPAGVLVEELFGTADVSVWYTLNPYSIYSQESLGTVAVAIQYAISGTIRDRQGNPVAYADIHVCNADTHQMVAHGSADAQGRYRLVVADGTSNHFLTAFYGTNPRKAGVTLDNLKGK